MNRSYINVHKPCFEISSIHLYIKIMNGVQNKQKEWIVINMMTKYCAIFQSSVWNHSDGRPIGNLQLRNTLLVELFLCPICWNFKQLLLSTCILRTSNYFYIWGKSFLFISKQVWCLITPYLSLVSTDFFILKTT